MIKDYNLKMLEALHSWFWYNGLLEQEGDEWVEFEKISRPKYSENCLILQLIKVLRETKSNYLTFDEFLKTSGFDMYYNEENNVLWLLLVEMFGECGTSPRSGWIEKKEECADFLQQIVEIEELE